MSGILDALAPALSMTWLDVERDKRPFKVRLDRIEAISPRAGGLCMLHMTSGAMHPIDATFQETSRAIDQLAKAGIRP